MHAKSQPSQPPRRDLPWMRGAWGFAAVWFGMPTMAGFMLALAVGLQTAFTLWAGYLLALTIVGMCLYEQHAPRVVEAMERGHAETDRPDPARRWIAVDVPSELPGRRYEIARCEHQWERTRRIALTLLQPECPVGVAINPEVGVGVFAVGADPLNLLADNLGFEVTPAEAAIAARLVVHDRYLTPVVRHKGDRVMIGTAVNVLA